MANDGPDADGTVSQALPGDRGGAGVSSPIDP